LNLNHLASELQRVFLLLPAQAYVAQLLQGFKESPPRQKPGSFNLRALQEGANGLPSNQGLAFPVGSGKGCDTGKSLLAMGRAIAFGISSSAYE
jgi:hypothetical protein